MKTLWKDLFREIIKTKSRFISLLLITLLGVAFFVGLRVLGLDMEYTANKYYEDKNLYDISFVSTYGFSKEDITAIKNDKKTEDILSCNSTDIYFKNGDLVFVAKTYALPRNSDLKMNKYVIDSGREIKGNDECLISKNYSDNSGLKPGDKLTVLDHDALKLKNKTLTIVGLATWSYYSTDSNYGSSKLGNGSVSSFMIVDENAFEDNDGIYTDLYVTLKGVDGLNCFYEDYKNNISEYKDYIKPVVDKRRKSRLKEVKKDALDKLDKAQRALDSKKSEVASKLKNAKNRLDKNKKLLDSNKKNLAKVKKKTYKTLDNNKKKLDNLKKSLPAKEKQLKAVKEKILLGKSELKKKEENFNLYVASLSDEQKEAMKDVLSSQRAELEKAKAELVSKESQVGEGLKQVEKGKKQIKDGYKQLEKGRKSAKSKFAAADKKITKGESDLKEGYKEYNKSKKNAEVELRKAQKKIDKNRKKIEDIEEVKWYTLDRMSNESFFTYQDNTQKVSNIGKVFPLIFFLVSILICLTTVTRMVEEQRTELGILKALGFSKWAVSIKFIVYAFLASFLGSILGMIIGFEVIPVLIYNAYRIMFTTPDLITKVYVNYVFIALFVGVFCTVGSAYYACNSDLREVASSLLRPKEIKSGKKVFLENIKPIWERLSFKWKITFRNLIRYKKRLVMSVVGIGGCCALLIIAFGIRYSISSIVDLQFHGVWNYDMELTTETDMEKEEISALYSKVNSQDNVKESREFYKDSFYYVGSEKDYVMNLMVPMNMDSINNYIDLVDYYDDDKSYKLSDDGVYITSRLAEITDTKAGDVITIKDLNDNRYEVKVNAVVNNYVGHYVFMSKKYYKDMAKKGAVTNTFLARLKVNEEDKYDEMGRELLKFNNVKSVSFSTRTATIFSNQLGSVDFVIVFVIFAAGLLAFVVMFNLDNINVSERVREIATLKVLGFYHGELNYYIVRENIILTILGMMLGALIAQPFLTYIMDTVAVDFVQFYNNLTLASYVFGLVLTAVFASLVNIFLQKTLKGIDMIESLKSVE